MIIDYNGFKLNSDNKVIDTCPKGVVPLISIYKASEKTIVSYFNKNTCSMCDMKTTKTCNGKIKNSNYVIKIKENKVFNISTDKNNEITKENWESIFDEGIEYCDRFSDRGDQYSRDKALAIFNKFIDNPEVYDCTGGAYVNLAKIMFLDKFVFSGKKPTENFQEDYKIESYYKKALEIKPTNQFALEGLAVYYYYTRQFEKSYLCYSEITGFENKQIVFEFYENVELNLNYYLLDNCTELLSNSERIEMYEKLYEESKGKNKELKVGYLLCHYYNLFGQPLNAYEIAKHLINKFPLADIGLINLITNICTTLKRYKEVIEYASKGLNKLEGKSNKSDNVALRISFTSNLCLAYNETNQSDKVIEILERQVLMYPNNTDFYNLAKAYYNLMNYDKALEFINKALYLYEDETSFYLLGKIYLALGRKEDAALYIQKAVYFMENENLDIKSKKDNTNSLYVTESFDDGLQIIYDELILCYINLKNYTSAYAMNDLAIKKWGRLDRFVKNESIINNFTDKENEKGIILQKLDAIEKEREKEREIYFNNANKVKEWALDLIKLQDELDININIDDEYNVNWEEFDKVIERIIYKMKNDSHNTSNLYKDIEDNVKSKYKNLTERSLYCLTTAEYLYQINKNSYIDFAPIVVEFTKVFEIHVNYVFNFKKKKMLNDLIYYIEKLNNKKMDDLIVYLNKLKFYRNGSAHTGVSNLEKVNKVRELLYEMDGLNILNSLEI